MRNSIIALVKNRMAGRGISEYFSYALLLLDKLYERIWELRSCYFRSRISDGELNAILRRNGYHGLRRFIMNNRAGAFGRRNFIPGNQQYVVDKITREYPDERQRIIDMADSLCKGCFDVLGSGKVDMRRLGAGKGYRIDWSRDPITGHRYKKVFSQYRWNPFTMRKGDADVKGPWEITRCQHFAILGQAYWLTRDEKYAECYAKTITDFIRLNPPGTGVHWACNMDVGLRVVNWLIGLSFFQGSEHLSYRWWKTFIRSLVEHGRYILNNLEFGTLDGKIIVSNHGLANLLGLYWLALNFPALDAGCVWRGVSERGLEEQVRQQILDDGGCFESSIPYHRLVVEMFLSAYALSKHAKVPFSEEYRDRLLKAMYFIRYLRQDDGRLPQIGDADNGRAHIFYQYGIWEKSQEKMDHLLEAGAVVLGCDTLRDGLEKGAGLEGLFWRDAGDQAVESISGGELRYPVLFEKSGIAVLRAGPSYIAITNSECGTFGIGNHKHNDQMAIEWSVDGNPIFVDAGSYTYTRDPDMRNEFRSTRIHNTVMVNETEQNILEPEALFRLQQQGEPYWKGIKSSDDGSLSGVWAGHTAYTRLAGCPVHERRVTVEGSGCVIIDDFFTGEDVLDLRFHYLLYPGIEVKMEEDYLLLCKEKIKIYMHSSKELKWRTGYRWYSGGYGIKISTGSLFCNIKSQALPCRFTVMFLLKEEMNGIRFYQDLADKFWGNNGGR